MSKTVDIQYYGFFGNQKKMVSISSVYGRGQDLHIDLTVGGLVCAEFVQYRRKDIDGAEIAEWRVFRGEELQQDDISYLISLIEYELDLLDETLMTRSGVELRRTRTTKEGEWTFYVNGSIVKRWIYFNTRQDWYWSADVDHRVEELKIIYPPE